MTTCFLHSFVQGIRFSSNVRISGSDGTMLLPYKQRASSAICDCADIVFGWLGYQQDHRQTVLNRLFGISFLSRRAYQIFDQWRAIQIKRSSFSIIRSFHYLTFQLKQRRAYRIPVYINLSDIINAGLSGSRWVFLILKLILTEGCSIFRHIFFTH